jgi:DMSO/TMAO reductase YedYZ molybdopterin-dependent catalytic subunit
VDVLTPVERFFVRNNFAVPEAWTSLDVTGLVSWQLSLQPADLAAMEQREVVATLECAGNGRAFIRPAASGEPWRLGAVSTAKWSGVPLNQVLDVAGVGAGASEIVFTGADGFARSLPHVRALHPDSLLALRMNGGPLTAEHGAPVRLVIPGWYGMAAVKWLCKIEVVDKPFAGYFQAERYVIDGRPVRGVAVRSVVVEPHEGDVVPRGTLVVRGLAWSSCAVASVQVRSSGARGWSAATLAGTPASEYAWRWWEAELDVKVGPLTLLARATDVEGRAQPLEPVVNPLGYCNNAAVQVAVTVV